MEAMIQTIYQLDDTDALLSAHALVLKRPQVPRIYLAEGQTFSSEHAAKMLTTSMDEWNTLTGVTLKGRGIPHAVLHDMRGRKADDLLAVIEKTLGEINSHGQIHYEMSRFTPFTNEDCTSIIESFEENIDEKLLIVLAKRTKSKYQAIARFGDLGRIKDRVDGLNAYQSVLMEKINRQWQKSWKSENCYLPS